MLECSVALLGTYFYFSYINKNIKNKDYEKSIKLKSLTSYFIS